MLPENSLKEIQKRVNTWIGEHGGYWSPLSMVCAIMEELGEVAREINSREGFKPKKDDVNISNLGGELADLIFSITCLANHYHINLSKEFENTLLKYSERDSNRFLK
ncbi:MAG: nucleotide pyrophosphohydrolase [Promethearchaeota archaeon]|jgi:NTP pyrophosphatase (non-canonical NTP hydrolase)